MRISSLLMVAATAIAAPTPDYPHQPNQALYWLINNPAGSSVLSLDISTPGQPSSPVLTSTGGNGLIGRNYMLNQEVIVDSMFSGGAITVVGNYLFTLNPGSDTLSTFYINPNNPQELRLIGNPVPTLGDFPNSVDYSPVTGLACVSNAAHTNGVVCYNVTPYGLHRNTTLFGTGYANQSFVYAEGPPETYSEVAWSPNSDYLLLSVKGQLPINGQNVPGKIVVWPWNKATGTFGAPTVNTIPNIYVDFAFIWISETQIWIADPSFGGAMVDINPSTGVATEIVHTALPNEELACWGQFWPEGDFLYTMDAGINNFYKLTSNGTYIKQISNAAPSGLGTFDSIIAGGYLYALNGAPGITILNLYTDQTTFYSTSSTVSNRQFYQGMATWPASAPGWGGHRHRRQE